MSHDHAMLLFYFTFGFTFGFFFELLGNNNLDPIRRWKQKIRPKPDTPAIAYAKQAEADAGDRITAIDALLNEVRSTGGRCVIAIEESGSLHIKASHSTSDAAILLLCAGTIAAGQFIQGEAKP